MPTPTGQMMRIPVSNDKGISPRSCIAVMDVIKEHTRAPAITIECPETSNTANIGICCPVANCAGQNNETIGEFRNLQAIQTIAQGVCIRDDII